METAGLGGLFGRIEYMFVGSSSSESVRVRVASMVCVDGTTVVVDSLKIAATWAALDKVVSRVDDFLVGAVTRLLTLSVGAGMGIMVNPSSSAFFDLALCLCRESCGIGFDGVFSRGSSMISHDSGAGVTPDLVFEVKMLNCPLHESDTFSLVVGAFFSWMDDFDCELSGLCFLSGTLLCFLRFWMSRKSLTNPSSTGSTIHAGIQRRT